MLASDRDDDPPESTRLRIGDEVAWSDVNGVYDRDHSLKENTNPKCLLDIHHLHYAGAGHHHHSSGSSSSLTQSCRFSGNLKPTAAPIIGLSGTLGGGAARRHHHHHHAKSATKTTTNNGAVDVQQAQANKASTADPGSPRVSCFGTVDGSEEGRERALPSSSSGCCGGLMGFLMRRGRRSRNCSAAAVDELKEVDTLSAVDVVTRGEGGEGGGDRGGG